jgi:chromosome segregation ATPase
MSALDPPDPGTLYDERYQEIASLESRLASALASTRTAVEALEKMTAERDEWKHEAQSNAAKLEGEMNLRHRLTEQAHEIERLREQVKVEHEGFTGRRKEKSAQWDALVAERDRETERANKAFRERDEARAQVAQLREVLAYAKVNVKPTAIWCFAAIDAALARTPSPDRGGGK